LYQKIKKNYVSLFSPNPDHTTKKKITRSTLEVHWFMLIGFTPVLHKFKFRIHSSFLYNCHIYIAIITSLPSNLLHFLFIHSSTNQIMKVSIFSSSSSHLFKNRNFTLPIFSLAEFNPCNNTFRHLTFSPFLSRSQGTQ